MDTYTHTCIYVHIHIFMHYNMHRNSNNQYASQPITCNTICISCVWAI